MVAQAKLALWVSPHIQNRVWVVTVTLATAQAMRGVLLAVAAEVLLAEVLLAVAAVVAAAVTAEMTAE
jgi:hypothetical protein